MFCKALKLTRYLSVCVGVWMAVSRISVERCNSLLVMVGQIGGAVV